MKKTLALLLSLVLLLPLFSGCSPEPVKMLWTYNDYGKTYSPGGPSATLKKLYNDSSTDGALFCIAIEDDGEETEEQRKARVQNSKPMGTRVEQDKRKYNRKQKHKREWKDYE